MEEKRRLILAQIEILDDDRCDYSIVDLEGGEVLKTKIPSLMNSGFGDVVKVGGIIYHIGSLSLLDDDDDQHIHMVAYSLDLNIDDIDAPPLSNKWKDIPPMNELRVYPSSVSLDGKLYAFDCLSAESHIGEVFDPSLGHWEPLPPPPHPPLDGYLAVSYPVISDEKKHRLVVHLETSRSLYAYYPHLRSWDCLVTDFHPWYSAAITLVDDVIFFHKHDESYYLDCIVAFDLLSKTWLKVKYSSNFPYRDISLNEWENMLHLGDDILCLATFIPFGNPVQTNLWFVKLRFQRISSQELLLTFVSSQQFPFQGRLFANRFILL